MSRAMHASPGSGPAVGGRSLRWLAAALAVLALAAFVRLSGLDGNPPGLHGDEAVTGIEGQRILDEGWIGLYSPLAHGQPSGPLHATALSVLLFGHTVLAVRVVAALAGIATVAALYLLLRRNADEATALAGALVLATLGWAVHFSRVGFPVAFWPLVVTLAAAALLEAIRRRRPFWWALAGVLAGAGLYVYNAHPLPLALLAGFGFAWLLRAGMARRGSEGAAARREAAAFGAGIAASAAPLVVYALSPEGIYLQRLAGSSFSRTPEWLAADWPERVTMLASRYGGFWRRVCCASQFDASDGSGLSPLMPLPFLLLAVAGMAVALRRPRKPWAMLGLVMAAALPLASVLTVDAGARRTLVLAPVLAAFAGYGAASLWRAAGREGRLEQAIAGVGLAMLLVWGAAQDLIIELRRVPAAPQEISSFGRPLAAASLYIDSLPPGTPVRWYSARWPAGYETRRYLAPDAAVVDGSSEFGDGSILMDHLEGPQVFVLLDAYLPEVTGLERRYPEGERLEFGPVDEPDFIAYVVDGPPVTDDGSGVPTPDGGSAALAGSPAPSTPGDAAED